MPICHRGPLGKGVTSSAETDEMIRRKAAAYSRTGCCPSSVSGKCWTSGRLQDLRGGRRPGGKGARWSRCRPGEATGSGLRAGLGDRDRQDRPPPGQPRRSTPSSGSGSNRSLIKRFANRARLLYGGSVKPDNVDALMAEPDMDGMLVGGASLEVASFRRNCSVHKLGERHQTMNFLIIFHTRNRLDCAYRDRFAPDGKGAEMGAAFGGASQPFSEGAAGPHSWASSPPWRPWSS